MTVETDEDEHSIELHLPYVRKVFEATKDGMLGSPHVSSLSDTTSCLSLSPAHGTPINDIHLI